MYLSMTYTSQRIRFYIRLALLLSLSYSFYGVFIFTFRDQYCLNYLARRKQILLSVDLGFLVFSYIGGPHRPARPFSGAGPARFRPPQTPGRPPFPGWHFLENSLPGALPEGWPGPLFRAVSAFRPQAGPLYPTGSPRPAPPPI